MQQLVQKTEIRECLALDNCGQRIFAVLHRPVDMVHTPLICVFHGFASSKHGSNRSYVKLGEALSLEGIATLRFDFRGAGDSEGSLSDICFEDMLSDAGAVFKTIENLEGIDNSRIGLFGASLGGAIAVLSQVFVKKAKTMALWAPVASGELWYKDVLKQKPELRNADPKLAFETFRGIKIHPKFREQFGCMDAAKALSAFKAPILHMHGSNDETLSLAHQEAFRRHAFEGSKFITYPSSDHRLGCIKMFPEVVDETVHWFKKYL